MNGFLELNDMMNKNLKDRKNGVSKLGDIENKFLACIDNCYLSSNQISDINAHIITKKEVFDEPSKYASVEDVRISEFLQEKNNFKTL